MSARFFLYNLAEQYGSLAANNQAYPVENLVDKQPSSVWKGGSVSDYIELDFGASWANNISVVVLLNTNFISTDTIRIRASDSGTYSPADYDQTHTISDVLLNDVNAKYDYIVIWLGANYDNRYWRFDLSTTSAAPQIGELLLSDYIEFGIGASYRSGVHLEDNSELIQTRNNVLLSTKKSIFRTLEVTFESLTLAEGVTLHKKLAESGRENLLFWSGYRTNSTLHMIAINTIVGRLDNWTPIRHVDFPRFSVNFEIVEAL